MTAKDGTQRDRGMEGERRGLEIAVQEETENRRDAIKAKDGGSRDVKESATNCGADNQETAAVRHHERSKTLPADCRCFPKISKI